MLGIGDLGKSTSCFVVRNVDVLKTKKRDNLSTLSRLVPLTLPTSNSFYENVDERYALKKTIVQQGKRKCT